ncbi:MAG: hypothetical protein M0T85_01165 [Dehalococcoidales bacterium]|nr:hypothetical protein [Dehalococcoidales bacterium]
MKRIAILLLALLLFAMSAAIVSADDEDQNGGSHKAPEVPLALIYPAVGMVGYGVYRLVHIKK